MLEQQASDVVMNFNDYLDRLWNHILAFHDVLPMYMNIGEELMVI